MGLWVLNIGNRAVQLAGITHLFFLALRLFLESRFRAIHFLVSCHPGRSCAPSHDLGLKLTKHFWPPPVKRGPLNQRSRAHMGSLRKKQQAQGLHESVPCPLHIIWCFL